MDVIIADVSDGFTPRGNHFENSERLTPVAQIFHSSIPPLQCQTILADFSGFSFCAVAAQNPTPPFFHRLKRCFLVC